MENKKKLLLRHSMTLKTTSKKNFCFKYLSTMDASTQFLCVTFYVYLQSLCKQFQTFNKNLDKVQQNQTGAMKGSIWVVSKWFCENCAKVLKSHMQKSQELNHVLAHIEGKDLGQKFLLGIVLGVIEGLINRGFF